VYRGATMARATVLLVDDEPNILRTLRTSLELEHFAVETASDGMAALEKLRTRAIHVTVLDLQLPKLNGLEVLRRAIAEGIETPTIMMSGHASVDTAVQAIQLGARTFLEKPFSPEKLVLDIRQTLEVVQLKGHVAVLQEAIGPSRGLLGEGPAMRELKRLVARAASASASVLITGERGTGKELVARAIHEGSKRARNDMEKLNCAAVPQELIESELFGHEAGAFTGAVKMRKGRFERAQNSTLFLDEVGDMPAAMQAKLLRVLQEGEVERVGGSQTIKVDVRVVAATNRDLVADASGGRFRADLYDRLNVVPIRVPPLRERKEDIAVLVESFLPASCEANDRARKKLTQGALNLMLKYRFPGNVRELKNLIDRLVIVTEREVIDEDDVREALPPGSVDGATGGAGGRDGVYTPGTALKDMLDAAERDLIMRSLEHHKGNATHAARDLGLERSHFYKKMRALGIRRPGAADDEEEQA
jgi:DNA-binding NtrC family response regulator